MKIGKGNFHFRQGKGKMCSINSESLSCLANLFFGFGTTFRNCPFLEKIGEVRMKTGTSSELGLIQQILSLGGFISVIIDNMINNSCFLLHLYLSMLDFAFRSCRGRFFRLVSFSFVCNKCK